MTGFVILGIIGALIGTTLVVTGIRRGPDARPRNMVMLMGGMMLAAFSIVIAGFGILYQHSVPAGSSAGAGQ
jgi:hypothetical protein